MAVYSICIFEVEYSGHYFNEMSFLMKTAAYYWVVIIIIIAMSITVWILMQWNLWIRDTLGTIYKFICFVHGREVVLFSARGSQCIETMKKVKQFLGPWTFFGTSMQAMSHESFCCCCCFFLYSMHVGMYLGESLYLDVNYYWRFHCILKNCICNN